MNITSGETVLSAEERHHHAVIMPERVMCKTEALESA